MGRLLSDLYDHRASADYEGSEPDIDTEDIFEDAQLFVAHVETLV